jgi:cytosine/adenosine deaminase-related metal-dependent hydrolase
MIVRARIVVTMDGPPIENGAVAISGKQIVDVGTFKEVRSRNSGEIVDLAERALFPGLINAHCHLDYTRLRGKIPRLRSFANWIRAINAEKARLTAKDYIAAIEEGFAEAKRFGTTTIANLTAVPDLVPELSPPIRTWWFGELIDVRGNVDVDVAVKSLQSAEHWGLAPHAPFTASAELYRRCESVAPLLTTHVGESRDEMSMFHQASGPLYDLLKEFGRDMSDCGGTTPVKRFLSATDPSTPLGMTNAWLIVHLNELTDQDFDLLRQSDAKFSIVHCPRSHSYFDHSPFHFERLRELGFNICLGTDSLATNDDLSLLAEMRAFQREFSSVSPEEILAMVTVNPARALQQQNQVGQIRAGFRADLITVSCAKAATAYEEILGFEGGVEWMVMDGCVLVQRDLNSQKPLFFSQT